MDDLADIDTRAKRQGTGVTDRERFVWASERLLVRLGEVLGSAGEVLVALHIQQRVMMEGKPTVRIMSHALRPWGVGRDVKRRTLAKLAAAGLIEFTERTNHGNPTIRAIGTLWQAPSEL
jgi:hypothetical protein